MILTGFSRGALACNYIGLHDDEIAKLWHAFIPYSHYDGLREWGYPSSDRASAAKRLARMNGRPQFICQESSIANTHAWLAENDALEGAVFQETGFSNHNDAWLLHGEKRIARSRKTRPAGTRPLLQKWLRKVVDAPDPMRTTEIASTSDGATQKIRYQKSYSQTPTPLLVVLHTWSADYTQDHHRDVIDLAIANKWAVIHPDFRGVNRRPEACGSDLAVQDVVDAVEWAKSHLHIDPASIYLCGTSGGGHMALQMAGRAPKLWAGVSAWVPISDLAAWYAECTAAGRKYAGDLEKSCGGAPRASDEIDEAYAKRSPLTHLHRAKLARVPIDINAGIRDGHDGSVPISHSLRAFNALAAPEHQIRDTHIAHFVDKIEVPLELRDPQLIDPSYGRKRPLFRRESRTARVTIFDGDHEHIAEAMMSWFGAMER